MLHELQRPLKKSNTASGPKIGVEHHAGVPLGPNKKPRPNWQRVRVDSNIEDMTARAVEILFKMKSSSKKAVKNRSMEDLHTIAFEAAESVKEMTEIAVELASTIDSKSYLSPTRFTNFWKHLCDSRKINAEIIAHEAKQSVKNYIINPWVERSIMAARDVKITRDTNKALISATLAIDVARRIGNELLDKATKKDTIQEVMKEAETQPESQQVAIAIAETEVIYMKTKEQPAAALKREDNVLGIEIGLIEVPAYALVEGAVMAKREANLAATLNQEIADIEETPSTSQGQAEAEFVELRKQHLQELETIITEDVEARKNKQEHNLALDNARRGQAALAEQEARREAEQDRANNIGTMLLQAVPTAATPIMRAMAFARQVDRWVKKYRRHVREQPEAGASRSSSAIMQRAQRLEKQLGEALSQIKVAIPENMSEWAVSSSPKQVISRLKAMKKVGVEPTSYLNDLLEELQGINVPLEEPGEELEAGMKRAKSLKKPIKLILDKLDALEPPIFSPSQISPGRPLSAKLNAPRDYDEIMKEMEAIMTAPNGTHNPHFWILMDEAERAAGWDLEANTTFTMLDEVFEEVFRTFKLMDATTEKAGGNTPVAA
ncbi:hypothetical protein CDD81_340 [Ophiocordyceps australis]|uniref:Uncharacterized protein n=1 Tax=Ophiocordyceps australis TaxID=1399860 RepID=A0A2C5Y1G4_9HYPO|nr:hypothetical protein CDD81_340 [Ophiocordyceps australis]